MFVENEMNWGLLFHNFRQHSNNAIYLEIMLGCFIFGILSNIFFTFFSV